MTYERELGCPVFMTGGLWSWGAKCSCMDLFSEIWAFFGDSDEIIFLYFAIS